MEYRNIVTGIEGLSRKRYKVFIDGEFAFVLYGGELHTYQIRQGQPVSEEDLRTILTEILPKRAKKRSLNLLKTRPYTEKKLREKLQEGLYPSEVIDEAIEYVKSFRYIDDYDYARQYIEYHKESKSRRKLEEALLRKGISKDILEQVFSDVYENEEEQKELELAQAKRLLDKKGHDPQNMDWKEKQKLYAFLIRKGISSDVIRRVISVSETFDF